MKYTKEKLQGIIRILLTAAQDNLRNDGYVQPVGLIFTTVGMTNMFQFQYHGVQQKRASQAAFRKVVKQSKALAVAVITESWLKIPVDVPVDTTQSVADLPGRQEAIVIEAISRLAKTILLQVFTKGDSEFMFYRPVTIEEPFSWASEWTAGIEGFLQS